MGEFLRRSVLRKKSSSPEAVYVPHAETAAKLAQNPDAPYHIWVGEPPEEVNATLLEDLLPEQLDSQEGSENSGDEPEETILTPFKSREIPPSRGKRAEGKVVFTIDTTAPDRVQEEELNYFLTINQHTPSQKSGTFQRLSCVFSANKKSQQITEA